MRLIPVLDVFHQIAVRGVGGRRDEYRPLVTQLCGGSDPLNIATAYWERLNTSALYLADLDAIVERRPAQEDLFGLWALCRVALLRGRSSGTRYVPQ